MNGETVDVEWDGRVSALWAQINEFEEEVFRSAHALLVDELPAGSSVATFERAALNDSFGRPDLAILCTWKQSLLGFQVNVDVVP